MTSAVAVIKRCPAPGCTNFFTTRAKKRGRRRECCSRACFMRKYMREYRAEQPTLVVVRTCSECPCEIKLTSRTLHRRTCSVKCKKRRQRRLGMAKAA